MIIDISSYQKVTDWNKVKATPELEGIYIKACEGVNSPDPGFDSKAREAINRSIPIGFYHFCTLNDADVVSDARKEARYFVNLTKPYKASLPYVLDIEDNKKLNLPKDKVCLYIKTFFDELSLLGIKDSMLYSYTPFLNSNLPKDHGLGHLKLWIAAYTVKPILPVGWDKFYLWQYTSKGFINGITGNVDLNKKSL